MFSSYQHIATSHADLTLSVHDRINDLHRRAFRLAPRVEESASDSGCTDTRPTGPRQAKAWDMIAEALAWNAISDDQNALALAEKYEGKKMPYRIGFGAWDMKTGYTMEVTPILPDLDTPQARTVLPVITGNEPIYRPEAVSTGDGFTATYEIGMTGRVLFIDVSGEHIMLTSSEIARLRAFLAQVDISGCANCLDPANDVHAIDCPRNPRYQS